MKVSHDSEVGVTSRIPASDGFVDGNGHSADSTAVTNGVSVHEPNLEVVHVHVRDEPVSDEKLHTFLTLEVVRQVGVHEELKAVSVLRGHLTRLRRATMIARVTRDDDVVLAVVQHELNPRGNQVLCVDGGVHRSNFVDFHEFVVNVVGDEVAEQGDDNRINLDVLGEDVGYPKSSAEELFRTVFGNLHAVLVETKHNLRVHVFLDMPVACDPDAGSFGILATPLGLDTADRDGLVHATDHLVTLFERLDGFNGLRVLPFQKFGFFLLRCELQVVVKLLFRITFLLHLFVPLNEAYNRKISNRLQLRFFNRENPNLEVCTVCYT